MTRRTLICNAAVVTMDDRLGDMLPADVLMEGDRIAAIGTIASTDAEIVDDSGGIVIPGLDVIQR